MSTALIIPPLMSHIITNRVVIKLFGIMLLGISAISLEAAVPNAPINLKAASSSSTQIELSWIDNANNETEFIVERSPDGSSWTEIGNLPSDSTNFSDTPVSSCRRWYYRVKAVDTGTPGNWSNIFSTFAYTIQPGELTSSWTQLSSGTAQDINAITWDGTQLIAAGDEVILTSPDGNVWAVQSRATESYYDIIYANGLYVAVGASATGNILTSTDGATWVQRTSGTTDHVLKRVV